MASKLVLKFLFSAQLDQTLSQGDLLFSVFWFSEFSFSSWISWFQNLEIFPPFLRNSCDEIIWWFWVTIVTVIFTCRYFKLSWNTSALSQSNGRYFSGSSIIDATDWNFYWLRPRPRVTRYFWMRIFFSHSPYVHRRIPWIWHANPQLFKSTLPSGISFNALRIWFSSFPRRRMTYQLQLCGLCEDLTTNVLYFYVPKRLCLLFCSRIVSTHFAKIGNAFSGKVLIVVIVVLDINLPHTFRSVFFSKLRFLR